MESVFQALRVEIKEDLMPLSDFLYKNGIPHRVYEESGHQILVVPKQSDATLVNRLYKKWKLNELEIGISPKNRRAISFSELFAFRIRNPACLLLILLSFAGFLITHWLPFDKLVTQLTFLPFYFESGRIRFGSMGGEYWRVVTPAFLHFGLLHLVFNSLWLWELGGKVERAFGTAIFLAQFVFVAAVSNLAQNMWSGPSLFGGMSGVVYGLFGFCWLESAVNPSSSLHLSKSLLAFMLGWLVLCMIGLVEAVGFGAIANAAHLGGIFSGMVLGCLSGFFSARKNIKSGNCF